MKPFEGLTVLDFTQFTAGPVCTYILADFGAEVIKIENPPYGDGNHYTLPSQNKHSIYIASLDYNKKCVLLNMKDPRQMDIFWKMVESADLIIDNFKAGTLGKFGVTYEKLHQINPKIVWTTMSGYGQTGPWSKKAAYDIAIQAVSGMLSVTGEDGGSPLKAGVSISDITAGLISANATIAALLDAQRTGEGRYIDLAMVDGSYSLLEPFVSRMFATGETKRPMGTAHIDFVPSGKFDCADGRAVVFDIQSDEQFRQLCEVLKCSELADNSAYACQKDRIANRDVLTAKIADRIVKWNTEDFCNAMRGAGLACSPIYSLAEAAASEQTAARNMLVDAVFPDGTTFQIMGSPIKLSDVEDSKERFCHELGHDTIEVYSRYADAALVHEIFDPVIKDCMEKWEERTAAMP